VRLTKQVIDAAELPTTPGAYYLLRDSVQGGLAVRVTAGGAKSFVFDGRLGGRMVRRTLKATNVAQARQAVNKLRGANKVPESERGGLNLEQFFNQYVERHARPHKKSWADDVELFDAVMPKAWRASKLTAITPAMVSRWHHDLTTERGPYRANRSLALLRCVFNRAKDWQLFAGENPCRGTKMNREQSRERFLTPDEVKRLNDALLQEPNESWRAYFPLSLLTGIRSGDLLAARWENIDLDAATLTLPGTSTKGGRTVVLPLSPPALDILKQLPSRAASEWVFPAKRGESGHMTSPKKAWAKLVKRAGLTDVRPHDLRRTVGSWLAARGYSLSLIGRALGHQSIAATQVYARLDTSDIRVAMDQHAAMLQQAVNGAVEAKADGSRA
jgi:integrase